MAFMITIGLIITTSQFGTFFFQLGEYISGKRDAVRKRLLLLTLMFAAFNLISWFIESSSSASQNSIPFLFFLALSTVTAAVYYYHSYRAFRITIVGLPLYGWLMALIFIAGISTLIYAIVELPVIAALLIVTITSLILFISWQTLFQFARKNFKLHSEHNRTQAYLNNIGLFLICLTPIVALFIGFNRISYGLYNLAYLAMFVSYLLLVIKDLKNRDNRRVVARDVIELSMNSETLELFNRLTKTQKEVAAYILSDFTHKEIAKQMFITTNTVTSHASAIYKKAGCADKIELKQRFKSGNSN